MLGTWMPHADYQHFVVANLRKFAIFNPNLLYEHENLISKLYILNLDPLKSTIHHLYSCTGRPSNHQPEIFRSFIIMNALGITVDEWCNRVSLSPVLRIIAGFPHRYVPKVASYYDFINRIYTLDDSAATKHFKRKPSKKYKKGEKLPPKHSGIVAKLVDKILEGRRFDSRPELTLQNIFANVSVNASHSLDLIGDNITMSGDGTCIETGASPYGRKTCTCCDNNIYNCDCPRRFSDPFASWGWDSHEERYFYGYTGYFLSTYNKDLKLDLPLYLRIVDAKRGQKPKYPPPIDVDDNGVPICPAGHKMIYWGANPNDHSRIKWRCPRHAGKKKLRPEPCEVCNSCSPSSYGRTTYTKPDWDVRLFTTIPRGTDKWKSLMKERTAAERVNNRILNDYGIGITKQRGKKRIFFMTTIAAMNVHLDAQLAKLTADGLFDFQGTFGLASAA